jgi:hypothetical protein
MHGVVIRTQFFPEGDAREGQALKCVFVAVSVNTSCITAECNILDRFVLVNCGAVAACEDWLLRAAANDSL